MNLRDVIKHLQKLQGEHGGDMPVYVNGEYGESEPVVARQEHFAVGKEFDVLGGDNKDYSIIKKVMQIGGY